MRDLYNGTLENVRALLPAGEADPALNKTNSLEQIKMEGLDLTGLNLTDKDLASVDFSNTNITGT